MANEISIDIRAINTTGPEFEKIRAATKTMGETVAAASKSMGEGFGQVSRVTRALAADVGSSLNPTLGAMVGNLGLVARGAGSMGAALAGVTAVAVVGAVALKSYFDSVLNAAEAQAKLNIAVKSFDIASTQQAMLAASIELEAYAERAKTFGGRLRNAFGDLSDALGLTRSAMQDLQAAAEATGKALPLAQAKSTTEALLQQAQATLQLRGLQLGTAEVLNDEREYLRLIGAINQELSNQFTLEERNLRLKAQEAIGAAEARHASAAEIGMIQGRLDRDITSLATRSRAAFEGLEEQQRRVTMGRFAAELQGAVAGAGALEQVTAGVSAEDAALGVKRGAADAERLLAIDQARVTVLREQGALTDAQRLTFELYAIAAERDLKVKQAGTDLDKQELANLEASVRTADVTRVAREQQEPLEGLAAGFRMAADEAERSGAIMMTFAQQTASNMQRTFSDQFFSVITGDFKKLPDLGRQFGLAMVRSLTDAFATMATAPLLRSLQQGLGLGGGQGFVRGLGALGGGMSAGGLVEVGGQLFQSVAAGGGQTVLVPTTMGVGGGASTASALAKAGVGGGGTGGAGGFLSLFSDTASALKAFLNTPLSSVAPSLFGGSATVAAGSTAFEMASLGEAGASIQAAAAGSSATIGTALGAVGAIAALAFTVYSGLSNPPTAQNIASGAVSGALSGAMLGTMISPGWGTVIGAVAGAAVGGGAAAMGKEDPAIKKQRQQAEVNRAVSAAQGLGGAVQATNSLEELFELLVQHGSGYVGGTSSVAIVSYVYPSNQPRVGPWLMIGHANPYYPVATVEEFGKYGEKSFTATIQAGVNPAHLSGPNADLETAVRSKIGQLTRALAQIELSTSDLLASPFGGMVQRTTTFRADQAGAFAGQQLRVEGASLNGLTPEQRVAFLKQLAKDDMDHNLNILYRDPATDEIVSISSTPWSGDVVRA
jgi:Sec-independent protein translocase protein TatA